jgi:hypothetical protein
MLILMLNIEEDFATNVKEKFKRKKCIFVEMLLATSKRQTMQEAEEHII